MSAAQWFLVVVSGLGLSVGWRALGLAHSARKEVEVLAKKLAHLENEHILLERRVFAVIPSDEMVDEEPVFKTGDTVEVRHGTGDWYVAKFCGFTRITTGTVLVMLESADKSMYPIDSIVMRPARTT